MGRDEVAAYGVEVVTGNALTVEPGFSVGPQTGMFSMREAFSSQPAFEMKCRRSLDWKPAGSGTFCNCPNGPLVLVRYDDVVIDAVRDDDGNWAIPTAP